jgi:hypothetical protein
MYWHGLTLSSISRVQTFKTRAQAGLLASNSSHTLIFLASPFPTDRMFFQKCYYLLLHDNTMLRGRRSEMKSKVVVSGLMLTLLLMGMLTFALSTDVISAAIDITPDTINLKSRGEWITCRIGLPEGYDASNIDQTTVMLNASIPVDPFWFDMPEDWVVPLLMVHSRSRGRDAGFSNLMVKFNRTAVAEFILAQGITYGNVTLTITGDVDGTPFQGSDVVKGRMPGDVDSNGIVDIVDIVTVAVALDSTSRYTDLNEDVETDVWDVIAAAINFGNEY